MKRFILALLTALLGCVSAMAEMSVEIMRTKGTPFKSATIVEGVNPRCNALQIDSDKLYLGAGNMLYIFSIADPMHPSLLGSVRLEGLCRQIAVKKNQVFVACRESGLWIVDASESSSPKIITRYDPIELPTGLDVYGNVLFLAERTNGVEFVDITDIRHPEHIYLQKTSESQSVWYQDGILYSGDWGKKEITAISASDMSSIKVLSRTPLWGHGDGVFSQGKYLYAATGHHSADPGLSTEENYGNGHSLQIFDISDKAEPVLISTTHFDKLYIRSIDYWTARPSSDGKSVFVADTYNGLYAVDTKKVSRPEICGHVVFKADSGKQLAVTSIAVGRGVVYASVINGGLVAIECPAASPSVVNKGKAPVNASFRHAYRTRKNSGFVCWMPDGRYPVRSVAALNDILFAACSDGGLAILRLSEDGSVDLLGKGPQAFAEDVKIHNGKLYVAEGREGLAIYDIIDGVNLKESDRIGDIGNGSPFCLWVEVPNDDCIIASPRGEYYWIDAQRTSDPSARKLIAKSAGWDRYVPNHVMAGNMYAHVRPHLGLVWVDLSKPVPEVSKPVKSIIVNQRSGISNYKEGSAVVLIKKKMYILEPGVDKLPDSGIDLGLNGAPMWDGSNLLAVTERMGHKVTIFDVSDDSAPKVVFEEKTTGQPEMPIFHNGRLIVPGGFQGLLIQK